MNLIPLIGYYGFWGVLGCTIFTLMVILFAKTGVFLEQRTALKTILTSVSILVGILVIQVLANFFSFNQLNLELNYLNMFITSYVLYYILFLFDTLIIDILVIVLWHPTFLELPDTEEFTSVKFHLKTIPIGTIIGAGLTLIGAGISYLILIV